MSQSENLNPACSSIWRTEEDLERGLEYYAEIDFSNLSPRSRTEVPLGILKYRQQMEEIKKVTEPIINESLTFRFTSGRGRNIRVAEPGKLIPFDKNDDKKIKKKIRKVQGLGYSNEIIENSIKLEENSPSSLNSDVCID